MKLVRKFAGKTLGPAAGAFALAACFGAQHAAAQAPYLLPYTINNVVVPGTAPTLGATCVGTNGVVGTAYDTLGDGCPITSGNVVIGASSDIHDVGVDPEGNIYFLDNQGNGFLRRIDARSGIVTAYAGTATGTQPTVNCGLPTPTQDKYGDGCTANDGKANATPTGTPVPAYIYTANLAKARGLSVSKSGDVYLAGYNSYVIQRVTLSTGIFNLVAGLIAGGTTAAPKGNIGVSGYTGDGGIAAGLSGAKLNGPRGVTTDLANNIYIADTANNVIRKVTAATGIITTVVGVNPGGGGVGTAGATGDGGPATSATLTTPEDVEVDSFGNIYIADAGNNKVRIVYFGGTAVAKLITLLNPGVTPVAGNIYTIAGGGAATYAGTSVLANTITISGPRKIALDNRGNLYLADNGNNVIFFLDQSTGYIRVLAGQVGKISGGTYCNTTTNGDGCPGLQATLNPNAAMGVGVDASGNVYISDSGNKELRRLSTNQNFPATASGATTTQTLVVHFAPSDAPVGASAFTLTGSSDFTIASSACVTNPDLTQDCTLQVAFKPTRPGTETASLQAQSTLNGTAIIGITGFGTAPAVALDPGTASALTATVSNPQGIAQDLAGNTYVADTANNRVIRILASGASAVYAGTGTAGYTGDSGTATAATLKGPKAVTVTRDGTLLIADTGNNVVRAVSPVTGIITTFAGGATAVCSAAVDTLGDGCPATSATFNAPAGLIADTDGNTYIADTGNNVIRVLTPNGFSVYLAGGASTPCATGDTYGNGCAGNSSIFAGPTGLAVDLNHNLYVADTGDNEIRRIGANGITTAIAGTGANGASGNGGPATGAQLSAPTGVAVDAGLGVYIADTGNSVIRLVNSAGTITTTLGTLSNSGTGTLNGSAFAAQLASPSAVISTGLGRLLILDAGNNRILADDRGSVSYNFGRVIPGTTSSVLQIQETSTGSTAALLSANSTTSLFTPSGTSPQSFNLAGTGSAGCTSGQSLAPGTSCLLAASFSPSAIGAVTGTFTESTTNAINAPTPFISLSGTGALLTKTTSTTVVTGTPSYAVPFTVTTTVVPASCNTAAPSCYPTGTVTFLVDHAQVGLPVTLSATGVASTSITGLSVGNHTIDAVYSGDGFYAGSSAATLNVTIAQGITKTTVSAPASVPQFNDLTLSAAVTGPITTSFPTGSFTFKAGNTPLGTVAVNPRTGTASLTDIYTPPMGSIPAHYPTSFGLAAGTYQLTAVYSGDANYATSTSAAFTLVIAPDAPSFTTTLPQLTNTQLLPSATGTAQGSTGQSVLNLVPSNTVSGTVTFACSGMPANADCTFSPTSLTFTPTAGAPASQSTQITLFTDVPNGVLPTSSGMVGWPLLLASLTAMLGFRKQLRKTRLLAVLALFGLLAGGATVLTGCSGNSRAVSTTPVGVYHVTVTVSGSNAPTLTLPITFTVTAGVPGQL